MSSSNAGGADIAGAGGNYPPSIARASLRICGVVFLVIAGTLMALDWLSHTGGVQTPSSVYATISTTPTPPTKMTGSRSSSQETSPPPPAAGEAPADAGAMSDSSIRSAPFIDNALYWRQRAHFTPVPAASTPAAATLVGPDEGVYSETFVTSRNLPERDIFECYDKFDQFEFAEGPSVEREELITFPRVASAQPPMLKPKKRGEDNNDAASSSSLPSFYQYDFVLLPVGCFGDAPARGHSCGTTSCRAIAALSKFVSCGQRPIGLILGDNFYPNGLTRRTFGRLDREFSAKFLRHPSLRLPFWGTVGNHDLRPQLQYRVADPYWIMPEAHHTTPVVRSVRRRQKQQPKQQEEQTLLSVQVFLVSTQWGYDRNMPHMASEARWLDAALSNSTATIKIVASHEPIFGFLDFPHSRPLMEHIHPVLKRHRVPLFIAAHAHSVHFHRCTGGYYQLVSAGFADNLHPGARYVRPRGHFYIGRGASAVAINGSHIVVTAFDANGRHVFHHAVDWRKTQREMAAAWRDTGDDGAPVKNNNEESGGGAATRKRIQREEIGPDELWEYASPVCSPSVPRMNAPWCSGRR